MPPSKNKRLGCNKHTHTHTKSEQRADCNPGVTDSGNYLKCAPTETKKGRVYNGKKTTRTTPVRSSMYTKDAGW